MTFLTNLLQTVFGASAPRLQPCRCGAARASKRGRSVEKQDWNTTVLSYDSFR